MTEKTYRPAHPLKNKTVRLNIKTAQDPDNLDGREYRIIDWAWNMSGKSWQDCDNFACMNYDDRTCGTTLNESDDVVYGHTIDDNMGHLVHMSELGDIIDTRPAEQAHRNKVLAFFGLK